MGGGENVSVFKANENKLQGSVLVVVSSWRKKNCKTSCFN